MKIESIYGHYVIKLKRSDFASGFDLLKLLSNELFVFLFLRLGECHVVLRLSEQRNEVIESEGASLGPVKNLKQLGHFFCIHRFYVNFGIEEHRVEFSLADGWRTVRFETLAEIEEEFFFFLVDLQVDQQGVESGFIDFIVWVQGFLLIFRPQQ